MSRSAVIETVARHVLALDLAHPVRVGIDGVTAAGKSTFARELASALARSERPVIHTTLDGFHHPRSRRYARGRGSAEGYYHDAYDYDAVVASLLAPLGPTGNREYRNQVFDLTLDELVDIAPVLAPVDAILVVDGSFSLRRELRGHWDVGIFLSVAFAVAEDRAADRDAASFGSADEARRVTKARYHGAHRIHAEVARPAESADFVIANDAPSNPRIIA